MAIHFKTFGDLYVANSGKATYMMKAQYDSKLVAVILNK